MKGMMHALRGASSILPDWAILPQPLPIAVSVGACSSHAAGGVGGVLMVDGCGEGSEGIRNVNIRHAACAARHDIGGIGCEAVGVSGVV